MKRLFFLTVSFFVVSFVFLGLGRSARAQTVSDREEGLAHFGPANVGMASFDLRDPTRSNRNIHLMLFFPTDDDVLNNNFPIATYDQILPQNSNSAYCVPPILPFTTANTLCTLCEPPIAPETVCEPVRFNADHFASLGFVEGKKVYQGVSLADGTFPVVVNLPAGAPGIGFLYYAMKYASHEFIYVIVN